MKKSSIPYFEQETEYTCGPASCRMVLAYFDITKTEQELVDMLKTTLYKGTSPKNIVTLFRKLGFDVFLNADTSTRNNIIPKLRSYLKNL